MHTDIVNFNFHNVTNQMHSCYYHQFTMYNQWYMYVSMILLAVSLSMVAFIMQGNLCLPNN